MGVSQVPDDRLLETSRPLLPTVRGRKSSSRPRPAILRASTAATGRCSFGRLGVHPPLSTTAHQGEVGDQIVRHAGKSSPCLVQTIRGATLRNAGVRLRESEALRRGASESSMMDSVGHRRHQPLLSQHRRRTTPPRMTRARSRAVTAILCCCRTRRSEGSEMSGTAYEHLIGYSGPVDASRQIPGGAAHNDNRIVDLNTAQNRRDCRH